MAKGRDAKPHIGIFGRRNNGKSSLINVMAGQDIAIVSEQAGTTTDPVKKSMEIPGVGPTVVIDTAGIDDVGELGDKRVKKSLEILRIIDMAILVLSDNKFDKVEIDLIKQFENNEIPYILIHNKQDLTPITPEFRGKLATAGYIPIISFSTVNNTDVTPITEAIKQTMPETAYQTKSLIGNLLSYGDTVVLITPMDLEAPEGRLILPQVQLIRDIVDNDCVAVVLKEYEAEAYIHRMLPKPVLVVTDSQVFPKADAAVPPEINLTSFSIILAHHKGDFKNYLKGTPKLSELKKGDRVLILESCTHHVTCDDIGRVKIPKWLNNYVGEQLEYDVVSGLSKLPRNITDYAMIIQCGGCMITRRQIINRLRPAVDADIPVTNYGMAIAWIHGIYERAVKPFVDLNQNF
jgi:[FeFe] hydrogenase H-cluster maturation GTPase HydF